MKRLRLFAVLLLVVGLVCATSQAAHATILIQIDKPTQTMTVTVDGKVAYRWYVSTGATGFSTPAGTYKPFRMEVMHYSQEWDNAGMPNSIFFTSRGHAVHGSESPGPRHAGVAWLRATIVDQRRHALSAGRRQRHGGYDGDRQRARSRRILCRHPDTEAEFGTARLRVGSRAFPVAVRRFALA